MKRPQLTCILGTTKNSGGIKSQRQKRGSAKANGLETVCKDKDGKSTYVSLRFSRTDREEKKRIFERASDEMIRKSELHTQQILITTAIAFYCYYFLFFSKHHFILRHLQKNILVINLQWLPRREAFIMQTCVG